MLVKGRMRPEAVELWRDEGMSIQGQRCAGLSCQKEHIVPRARKPPGRPQPFTAKLDLLDPILPSWSFPHSPKRKRGLGI